MDNMNSTWTEAEITLATTIAEWTFFFGTMGCIMAAIFIATHILERAPAFLSLPGHGIGSIKGFVLLWFWPIIILGMLSPILMAHIIHNGVHVAGLTLVPQILPSTCEQAQQFHPFDMATSWPCEKDELIDSLHELPAGLYLDKSRPWCATAHEDASLLILPFDVGGQDGHAMYNDHLKARRLSKTDLYQTSINPLIPGHRTQLHLILESWRQMIVEGHWAVDEQGVSGAIEKFREVDESAEMARRYTAALHW
ncbi:hypothetical protein CKM354_000680600 [Cercospora kikuchii]|uniref:Uncharacterized protein n=1 Tax=Cercospora kikuchii TaxID=84275 RepID=A0A9P3CI20_9PEZI|nr:uncharacterized protein CKM354_000680600 [Cercospora kikuchii]GIZ43587.1 hypothetical protein CKM354_000680600 [Cercospora kikuchii]